MAKQPQLGDIVEVYCEKCRLNLDASIAAMVGDEIKQVQCRTCGNFVPFREPVPDSVKKERVFKRVLAMRDRRSQQQPTTIQRRGQEPVGPEAAAAAAAAARPDPAVRAKQNADVARWREATDQVDSRSAVPYTAQRSFREGEFVLHKTFGMGHVESVTEDEMVVLFREGEQTLPINREQD